MPGLFDGMRISTSGIRVNRILEEIVAENIANASNENYTRQSVSLESGISILNDGFFFGQGVSVKDVSRVRDLLLDDQIRNAASTSEKYDVQLEWLKRLESVYNEPSDHGISSALGNFWEAWSDLSNDPDSFATRSGILSRTENLTSIIRDVDGKLARLGDEINQALLQDVDKINALLEECAQLNKDIFTIEAGADGKSNTLRDNRDAVLNELSQHVDISYSESANSMVNIFIGQHPAVLEDQCEKLTTRNDPLDPTQVAVYWEYGDQLKAPQGGSLAGILDVRDNIIPSHRDSLNTFVNTLINEVNTIYSNGVPLEGSLTMESHFGYSAFDLSNMAGQHGSIQVAFYDDNNDVIRMQGIIIDNEDSLADIANKFDAIPGLDASLISDVANDGRLRLDLDTISGANFLGEARFAISNNTGGYDTSGFLDFLGFSQTDKSPILQSRDLTELQTILGVPSIAGVRAEPLGLAGNFTINAFETLSETPPQTNGHIVQQFSVDVAASDSIDNILAKINNLTAAYGISATVNGTTNQIEVTSSAQTDSEGQIQLAGGSDFLRLGFANDYRYPSAPNDIAPENYQGRADTTGLLSKLQFNTLFQGTDAATIDLASRISSANDIHAGYQLAQGDNALAIELVELQHAHVASNNQFTIGEEYENMIARIGTEVQQMDNLSENEGLLLEGFQSERSQISGVNLDEELANMIQYQRAYEANARMFATFDQMTSELLNILK